MSTCSQGEGTKMPRDGLDGKQMASGKRTTIYDLAELAGASPTAVSSVLNGTWRKRRIGPALAEKIIRLADEQGYSVNMQASGLSREKSNLIGMIVPKYDNRYFGSIVEKFEAMARERGLFPIITCTQRDAELEIQAAREMISHQVNYLISTGATDPDRITEICAAAGVRTLNLDLPGKLAPSVISDNRGGARELTRRILEASGARRAASEPLLFVGGRPTDHNTIERIKGFRDAHSELGIAVGDGHILANGYAAEKARRALDAYLESGHKSPNALFVSSTITLEGVVQWIDANPAYADARPHIGCFDLDPMVSALDKKILMLRQDVPRMLETLFDMIDGKIDAVGVVEMPTALVHDDPFSSTD
ncbi:MAG: LacI family DNA-binding transcriptional regulator [Pseudoxanthomonas sp.]